MLAVMLDATFGTIRSNGGSDSLSQDFFADFLSRLFALCCFIVARFASRVCAALNHAAPRNIRRRNIASGGVLMPTGSHNRKLALPASAALTVSGRQIARLKDSVWSLRQNQQSTESLAGQISEYAWALDVRAAGNDY